jgi:DtxR family Mn-dependent transcriptional regulator
MTEPLIALLIGSIMVVLAAFVFWPQGGLLARYQAFRRVTARVLQEDALKHIQKLEFSGRSATLQSVAGALNLDSNRAVDLVANLESLNLIKRDGNRLNLTQDGAQVALNVIRAHRLWEQYLAEHTGYNQSEWHNQAERFEHDFSSDELDQLAGSLGNPIYDPHGDPIPTREGQLWDHEGIPLTDLEENKTGLIVHVGDEPEAVAAQIEAEGLLPGMLLRVTENTKQRVRFWSNGNEHTLAPIVAASINVRAMEETSPQVSVGGIPLNQLEEGDTGRVLILSPHLRGPERRRLMDLGLLPGTLISAEVSSPIGDPIAYRIRDSLIALRSEQACYIQVEPIIDNNI